VKNRLVVGTILGQAVVTLAAICYGVSAHSSWEAERQRRIAGERAAVTEMAAALKGAGDRIITIERELERCQVRSRRGMRSPAERPVASAADTTRAVTPPELSTEEAFRVLAGPITSIPVTKAESRPDPATPHRATPTAPSASAWCEGSYETARGNNFAPCGQARP
jgi:hypothetical protein